MAVIAPFKGILYNPEKIREMSKVIAPPYEMISADGQEKLYQKSDYNVVRLDFAKGSPSDNDINNRYTRAASDLKKWQGGGKNGMDEKGAAVIFEKDLC